MENYKQQIYLKHQHLKKLAEDIGREASKNGLTSEILQEILSDGA